MRIAGFVIYELVISDAILFRKYILVLKSNESRLLFCA